jgi:hypothetical protein
LRANSQQFVAASAIDTPGGTIVDAMRQKTLTQCFNPPAPPGKTSLPLGYRNIAIDGMKYLLNDTMNHLMVIPTPLVAPSPTMQGVTPVDLSE